MSATYSFRDRYQVIAGWFLTVFLLAIAAGVALLGANNASTTNHTGIGWDVAPFAIVAPLIIGALRSALAAVLLDENGVTLRNFFSTKHFDWDEVERFTVSRPAPAFVKTLGTLELTNGNAVAIWAFQTNRKDLASGNPNAGTQRKIDEMNRLVKAFKSEKDLAAHVD